jgi:hypothetical protein
MLRTSFPLLTLPDFIGSHFYPRFAADIAEHAIGKSQTWSHRKLSGICARGWDDQSVALSYSGVAIYDEVSSKRQSSRDQGYMLDNFVLVLEIIGLIGVVALVVAVTERWWSG